MYLCISFYRTHKTLQEIVDAFHAALASISPNIDKSNNKYSVKGSSVFNAILQLCMFHIQPAIRKLLKIPASGRVELGKCKKWVKIRNTVKFYVANVYEVRCQFFFAIQSSLFVFPSIVLWFPKFRRKF